MGVFRQPLIENDRNWTLFAFLLALF